MTAVRDDRFHLQQLPGTEDDDDATSEAVIVFTGGGGKVPALGDQLLVSGWVEEHSPGALLAGQLEQEWRGCQINTFGGGVNETQREIVAMLGLGMPRAPR